MILKFLAALALLCASSSRSSVAASKAVDHELEARGYTPPDDCSGCDWDSITLSTLEWCYCCSLCTQHTAACISDNFFCMLPSRCSSLQLCQDEAIQAQLPASTTRAQLMPVVAVTVTTAAATEATTTTEAAAVPKCAEPDETCKMWNGFCASRLTMCPRGS